MMMIKSVLQHIMKTLPSKVVSYFGKEGRHGKEERSTVIGAGSTTNVNEEYKETLRTKSYLDICSEVEQQLATTTNILGDQQPSSSSRIHLLIEPQQETLLSISGNSKYHHFLINSYLEISQEAGKICESILQNLHQVRLNYHTITKVVKLLEKSPDFSKWTHNQYKWLLKDLASFSIGGNPFSSMTGEKFNDLRNSHVQLLHQLMTSRGRTKRRRAKFIKWMIKKRERKGEQQLLEIAARGAYALIKDFEALSFLVMVLKGQMEHNKSVAERCVARLQNARVLMELRTEFRVRDYSCFQEHLNELEQHIYLSFLHIKRSRKRLLQQLMYKSSSSSSTRHINAYIKQ